MSLLSAVRLGVAAGEPLDWTWHRLMTFCYPPSRPTCKAGRTGNDIG